MSGISRLLHPPLSYYQFFARVLQLNDCLKPMIMFDVGKFGEHNSVSAGMGKLNNQSVIQLLFLTV